MRDGERQVAPTKEGIRRDHVARYEFVAKSLPPGSRVIDFACGVGYGTALLAEAGMLAHGLDIDAGAIDYAREHYQRPVDGRPGACFTIMNGNAPDALEQADAAVEEAAAEAALLEEAELAVHLGRVEVATQKILLGRDRVRSRSEILLDRDRLGSRPKIFNRSRSS